MTPIGGASGDAYMGVKNNERVFFKRNSSPFLAALSAQGITPKLMWTQRTYSGDLLVAQEWKDGRLLSREDMGQEKVIQLIRSIHQSDYLLMMLKRSEDQLFYPLDFIALYLKDLPAALCQHHFSMKSFILWKMPWMTTSIMLTTVSAMGTCITLISWKQKMASST